MYVVLGITFGASLMLGKHSTIAHCVFYEVLLHVLAAAYWVQQHQI